MKLKLALFSLLPFLLMSCSSTPPICRPENARDAGIAQAMRGEDYSESQGGVCEEENRNIFKTNFQAGYQEGKNRFCMPSTVESTGQAHGHDGKRAEFSEASYRICESKAGLKAAYLNGYQRGLEQFCADDKARDFGDSVGQAGQSSQFTESVYAACGPKIKRIRSAYLAGHKSGLAKYCTGGNAEAQGMDDGTKGADVTDISGKYQICGSGQAQKISRIYVDAYSRGFARFCGAENISSSAKAQAQKSGSGVFPNQFQKCLSKYPELNIQFTAVFRDERKRVVESSCTYHQGLSKGQADGERTNDKVTTMPEFCDAQLFSVYLSGYLEGWKQTKDRLCNATEAYKQGVQTGLSGQSLSYTAPGNCPGEYQQSLSQKFSEGYYYGASQRPQPVQTVYPQGGQSFCRNNLECRSGEHCRNRGDGVTVCMGRGQRGFYCISSPDCSYGLSCRSLPQNSALRVCQ